MTVTRTQGAVDHGTPTSTEGHAVTSDGVGVGDAAALVAEDLLVEDVSIDGMCGVY